MNNILICFLEIPEIPESEKTFFLIPSDHKMVKPFEAVNGKYMNIEYQD